MPYFKWFGYDAQQNPCTGYIACAQPPDVAVLLQQQGVACVHASEIRHNLFKPCSFSERQALLHELSQLLDAKVRLSQALEIISLLVKKEYIRQVLLDCTRAVNQGKSFADAAERYPELFDPLTVHALKAGHDSGLLANACSDRSKQLTQIAEIRAKISAAVAMPLITTIFFMGILIFLMTVILPQFKRIFAMLKTPLPVSTQFLFKLAAALSISNLIVLVCSFFLIILAFIVLGKTVMGKKLYDNFLLYFPGVSYIYQDLTRAQALQSLALLLRSGRTLSDSLVRGAESFNNIVVREQLMHVQHAIQEGKPFTQAIEACPLLAIPEIKNCLAIAHETAELEVILQQLSIISRTRVLKKLDRLTLLIQPVLLIFLGAAIGGVLLALYLPLLQIPQMIS